MKTNIFFYSILIMIASGCAFHGGMMTGNASLIGDNFIVVRQASGYARTLKVLGVGGLKGDGLVAEARNSLYNNAKLQKGQALSNVAVDFKTSYFIVCSTTEVFITADIVDFDLKRSSIDSLNYLRQKEQLIQYNRQVKSFNGFELDQTVKFKKGFKTLKGKIVELKNDGALVEYQEGKGKQQVKFVAYDQLQKAFN